MLRPVVFFALVVLVASCGKPDFFSEDKTLEGAKWEMNKKLVYEVDVKDTSTFYDFFIDLRHNEDYPFADLYLFMDIEFPNGKTLNDTLHIPMLYQDKWLGRKSGSLIEIHHRIPRPKTRFAQPGKYKMYLRHAMRPETLDGIEDIGIVISEHEEK
jgi:gliding motility-associated lipoprotein GldH